MIWIVGAKGMLGQEVAQSLGAAGLKTLLTDREVDFTDLEAIRRAAPSGLEWIINCAAYTAVDKAEDERELCTRLNVEGPRNLGLLAEERGARVLHISTDYVFDGKGECGPDAQLRPYRETDAVNPQGYYGLTKAQGEAALQGVHSKAVIVRTAWLYGKGGPNFVFTMLRLMKSRPSLGVVADQWGSPTWTADLAEALLAVVQSKDMTPGIYHFSGEGQTTWHAFALAIQKQGLKTGILEKPSEVKPLTTAEYPTKTVRPTWSVLDKTKIKNELKSTISPWQESLKKFFERDREVLCGL